MFRFRRLNQQDPAGLLTSRLFDQNNFYEAFLKDLGRCRNELVIESPFITAKRVSTLLPIIGKLRKRGVRIIINTRHPEEHEGVYRVQAMDAISKLESIGVMVLLTGGHHRKVVVLDRNILWEGSLNVLSQYDTCEMMRRIASPMLAEQMIGFLRLERYLVQ